MKFSFCNRLFVIIKILMRKKNCFNFQYLFICTVLDPSKINDRSWKEKVRLLDPRLISFTVLRHSALTAIPLTDLTEIGCLKC